MEQLVPALAGRGFGGIVWRARRRRRRWRRLLLKGFSSHAGVCQEPNLARPRKRAWVGPEAGWSRTPLSVGSRDAPGRPQQHSSQDMPVRWSKAAQPPRWLFQGERRHSASSVHCSTLSSLCSVYSSAGNWRWMAGGLRPSRLLTMPVQKTEEGTTIARSKTRCPGRVPADGQQPRHCSGSRKADRHGACGVGGKHSACKD